MPEISRFYGIVIRMYFGDHHPPHFHAEYAGSRVLVNIDTLATIGGNLPPRAMELLIEWASLHQQELRLDWDKAQNLQPLDKIDPLP